MYYSSWNSHLGTNCVRVCSLSSVGNSEYWSSCSGTNSVLEFLLGDKQCRGIQFVSYNYTIVPSERDAVTK